MDGPPLVLDIKEKSVDDVKPPTLPVPSHSTTGFPAHKKRTRVSAFKQQRNSAAGKPPAPGNGDESQQRSSPTTSRITLPDRTQPGISADEKRRIAEENKAKIESMSQGEIEEAQRELLNELDPTILQMLLRRANLDDSDKSSPFGETDRPGPSTPHPPAVEVQDTRESAETPSTDAPTTKTSTKSSKKVTFDEDAAPPEPPTDLFNPADAPSTSTTHFPAAPPVADLNPSDPDFLANLHSKYFPNLPADPSKLAWMAPIPTADSPADRDSPYHPSQDSLPVSALRFDFRGSLLPPRISRSVPVSKGLHHHGEAPEAAGYTIPELARLARSAVPGQRCLAFQTLGRVLYRLGKGEWGVGEGGRVGDEDDLAFGLWRLFRQGRVIETLEEAAAVEEGVGHRGARAYAIEALWLFEKGGWKEKWRGM